MMSQPLKNNKKEYETYSKEEKYQLIMQKMGEPKESLLNQKVELSSKKTNQWYEVAKDIAERYKVSIDDILTERCLSGSFDCADKDKRLVRVFIANQTGVPLNFTSCTAKYGSPYEENWPYTPIKSGQLGGSVFYGDKDGINFLEFNGTSELGPFKLQLNHTDRNDVFVDGANYRYDCCNTESDHCIVAICLWKKN